MSLLVLPYALEGRVIAQHIAGLIGVLKVLGSIPRRTLTLYEFVSLKTLLFTTAGHIAKSKKCT